MVAKERGGYRLVRKDKHTPGRRQREAVNGDGGCWLSSAAGNLAAVAIVRSQVQHLRIRREQVEGWVFLFQNCF